MERMVKVNFRDLETKEFKAGTTLLEISKSFQQYFHYDILAAKVDNDMADLQTPILHKCDIDFFDRADLVGNGIYGHSLQFLLIVAVKRVLGENAEVYIEHSIDKGIYCELENQKITEKLLAKINDAMTDLVAENLIFEALNVERRDAIKYFKKKKRLDKVNVLKYISNSYVNLYRLDDVYDYFFSKMAYSTKSINEFSITYIDENGFVISYPNIYNPDFTLEYFHRPMIFDTFLEYTRWGRTLEIRNAADLNEIVSTGDYNRIIRLSEAHFESQLSAIANQIYEKKDHIKIILLAGPSSSGKTTTSHKLEVYLQAKGFRTHIISTDDYFLDRQDTPKDSNGEYDYESLKAIDVNLFNRHLTKLLEGEKVLVPEYNFILGKKEYKKKYLQLKEQDIVVIEGLHGLNEELTLSIDRKNKYKIYIGPFTQLNIDNHNRIHTSDTRKLRRIIRDNKFRGYNAADTLRMWKKIREGEEKYIFPYQSDTDAVINSALVYELGVLKTYAEPLLFSVPEDDPMYPEALRLINFLRNFLPIPSDDVPKDSILREFIGGSGFYN